MLLFLSYAARAAGFLILMFSKSPGSLFVFMTIYGFVLFASNPITSAATRELFGPKSFGTLYGYLIFIHYVGSFFGPLAGGMVYDRLERYDEAFSDWGGSSGGGIGLFACAQEMGPPWPAAELNPVVVQP